MKILALRKSYLFLAIILLLIEIIIAVFVKDRFVRPYLGDFLVVILLYCFVRTLLNIPVTVAAISVLLFAYFIEITQYFHLITHLGLQHSKVVSAILGWSFAWADIIAYTLGIITVVFIEKYLQRKVAVTYRG